MSAALSPETRGMILGFVGVLSFSLSLPATRLAVTDLDPTLVGLGRGVIAGILAAFLLSLTHQRIPTGSQLKRLGIVALGVVLGFPLLTAWAMKDVPAIHGAIVLGLLPLATALAGVWRSGDRPSRLFWMAGLLGSGSVVGYAVMSGAGQLHWADLWLLGSVIAAAIGYAEGSVLSKQLGNWQVISWAVVLSAPVLLIPFFIQVLRYGLQASPASWLGFAYVCVVSQFLGFFPWYQGLALGGVARVGQVQLLQPFLTILASALCLGEGIAGRDLLAGGLVVMSVALGRMAPIQRVETAG